MEKKNARKVKLAVTSLALLREVSGFLRSSLLNRDFCYGGNVLSKMIAYSHMWLLAPEL